MIASSVSDITVAAFGAVAIILAAVLPVLLLNRRTLKRTQGSIDTGNERSLGATVHDIADTVTVVQAQGHETARALYEVHERIGAVAEQVSRVGDKLDDHLAEVAPLRARAEKQVEEGKEG